VSYQRDIPEVKHVGLFGSSHWRRIAQRNGFDDALFTDRDSIISEIATSNIGFVQGDRVVWPRADWLPGCLAAWRDDAADQPGA
jgi:branched-subunit amino acid aminotransferase/4-amino-4-deoxychorismate lyase